MSIAMPKSLAFSLCAGGHAPWGAGIGRAVAPRPPSAEVVSGGRILI